MIDVDILIVGAGITGLSSALECTGKGNVAIISKSHPLKSNSINSLGGVNAALSPNDRWQDHFKDTVMKSQFLADQDTVELLVKEAPETVIELERMGILFTRTANGEISQKALDEQSFPRTCFVKEVTGHRILHTLHEQSIRYSIPIYENMFALKLIIENNTCKGLIAYDFLNGKLEAFRAKAVMLATGGLCRMYKNTCDSFQSTGDGLALAAQEGLPLQDLEFVQFHPTGLYGHGALITEQVRQAGAYLINNQNERFMKKYVPNKMEQAAREEVIKAIETEISKGFGCGEKKDCVLLDITHFGEKRIVDDYSRTRDLCIKLLDLDPVKDKIPVLPVAHYTIGGIPVNIKCQALNSENKIVTGLYAAGECSCISVHGANSLVGNSILEKIIFGKRCGRSMLNDLQKLSISPIKDEYLINAEHKIDLLLRTDGNEKAGLIRNEIQELAAQKVGVFRNQKDLAEARVKITELKKRFERVRLTDKSKKYNTELAQALETSNMLDLTLLIIECAKWRTESRGCHNRSDYKKKDDANWLKHTLITNWGNETKITYRPVNITKLKPKNGSQTENI